MRVANANMQPVWVKVTYNDKTVNYEHRGRRAGGEVGALNAKVGFHFDASREAEYQHCYNEPGFQKIGPGDYLTFDYCGSDGFLFVSVELDDALIADNHKVPCNTGLIVTKNGTLKDAKKKKCWIDMEGINHEPLSCPDEDDDSDVFDDLVNMINSVEYRSNSLGSTS